MARLPRARENWDLLLSQCHQLALKAGLGPAASPANRTSGTLGKENGLGRWNWQCLAHDVLKALKNECFLAVIEGGTTLKPDTKHQPVPKSLCKTAFI